MIGKLNVLTTRQKCRQILSKSEGKYSNNRKQFQDCLMTSIVHNPSPESVSTSSNVSYVFFNYQKDHLIYSSW